MKEIAIYDLKKTIRYLSKNLKTSQIWILKVTSHEIFKTDSVGVPKFHLPIGFQSIICVFYYNL